MKHEKDKYAEMFADYVNEAMKRTGMTKSQIAKAARLSRQTIGQIAGKKPNSTTGKLILPERETVDAIAKALGDPLAKARRAAGYSDGDKVDTIEQALDAASFFEQKGISDQDRQKIRPLLQGADQMIELLASRQPMEDKEVEKLFKGKSVITPVDEN